MYQCDISDEEMEMMRMAAREAGVMMKPIKTYY